jgi:hypothetical protein
MANIGFKLTGIKRGDFVSSPFTNADILAQVCSILPHAIPYAPDRDADGRGIDDFNNVAAVPYLERAGADCEDFAILTNMIAQLLHARGQFGARSVGDVGDSEVCAAIEKLAACYVPVMVDTVVSADRLSNRGARGTSQKERLLHMRCMLVPLPLVRVMLSSGKQALSSHIDDDEKVDDELDAILGVGSKSPVKKARETSLRRIEEVIAAVDASIGRAENFAKATREQMKQLPVLGIESTDGCRADPADQDPLSMRVAAALAGSDDYRGMVPFHAISATSGPTTWCRFYIGALGQAAYEFAVLQPLPGGKWRVGAELPPAVANLVAFMMDTCAIVPICEPTKAEKELVRLYYGLCRPPMPLHAPAPQQRALSAKSAGVSLDGTRRTTALLCIGEARGEDFAQKVSSSQKGGRRGEWKCELEHVWLTPELSVNVAFVTETEGH